MNTYIFKIYFNILQEADINVIDFDIEPIEFSKVAFKKEKELTENQIITVKNKLKTFYKNKFDLSSIDIKLDSVIK